jgi:protocatechuate 3,4-dioxygenase beta subunit
MSDHPLTLTRRQILGYAAGLGGSLLAGLASAGPITAESIAGPYYPVDHPLDDDADLTFVKGRPGKALGQVIELHGRVTNEAGAPVPRASIELWQANTHGRYDHRSDPNVVAPVDPAFQGYSRQTTDYQGRFRFRTVRPGAYPATETWLRTPHIHFDVRGHVDRRIIQLYFADEPLNDTDALYQALSASEQATVTVALGPHPRIPGAQLGRWDIVLATG